MADDVILSTPGDLLRFSTLDEAGPSMEPIDVRNGEWRAWYATGQVLEPTIEMVERGPRWFRLRYDSVVLRPTDTQDPEGLLHAVQDWLVVHGVEAPASLDEALAAWALLRR